MNIGTITFHDGKSRTNKGAGYRGYHTLASLKGTIAYITKEEKTKPHLICGFNCNPQTAYEEMVLTKKIYNKDKEDGKNRMLIHFSQNLVEGETTPEQAKEIADRLLEHPFFNGFQVVYATHIDTGKLHTHFVINTVNMEDGHKWEFSKKDLQELKDYSDSILKEYHLYVVPKIEQEKVAFVNHGEWKAKKEGRSWKYETFLAVKNCKEYATSKEEFVKALNKLGYQVDWKEEHKYITFTNKDGKKIRNKKLYPENQFTKEALEKRFKLNLQYQKMNEQQKDNEKIDTAVGLLRLLKQFENLGNEKYPLQKLEKDFNSRLAKMDGAKEAEKGRGMNWEID